VFAHKGGFINMVFQTALILVYSERLESSREIAQRMKGIRDQADTMADSVV